MFMNYRSGSIYLCILFRFKPTYKFDKESRILLLVAIECAPYLSSIMSIMLSIPDIGRLPNLSCSVYVVSFILNKRCQSYKVSDVEHLPDLSCSMYVVGFQKTNAVNHVKCML